MRAHRVWPWGAVLAMSLFVASAAADPIENIINQTSLGEYQSYLRVLSGVDPVPGNPPVCLLNRDSYGPLNQVAGQWIRGQFESFGLSASLHPFTFENGLGGQNVIGELLGSTRPEDIYVICAHYDTFTYDSYPLEPGCDDNGSGAGAVLMAARILSQYQFEGTVRFIAFSGEEQGLVGSHAYVQAAHEAGENIVAAINLDMILHPGFDNIDPDPDYDLDIATNSSSAWLATYLAGQFGTYTPIDVQVYTGGYGSDHYSFWGHAYNAIGLSENTAGEIWGGSNYEYHEGTDTFDNPHLDWNFGLQTVRGGMAGLAGLAGLVPEPGAMMAVAMLVLLARHRRHPATARFRSRLG
jgi:hypothetical protein